MSAPSSGWHWEDGPCSDWSPPLEGLQMQAEVIGQVEADGSIILGFVRLPVTRIDYAVVHDGLVYRWVLESYWYEWSDPPPRHPTHARFRLQTPTGWRWWR